MINPDAQANEMYYRLQADLHRKYSELQRLKEIAKNDIIVHHYLSRWERGSEFRSFEEMLICMCVALSTQKQEIERIAKKAIALEIPPIVIHGGTRE